MTDIFPRKYGAAATVDFALYKLDGTGLKTDAASATGDVTLYRDEAGVETLDADAFVDEGAIYSLAISQTEMTATRIIVAIVDQSSPQVWLDKTLIVETYGHASAQHPFDLGTDKIGTITNTGGTATLGAVLGDMANSAVVTRLGNAQTELNKIGTVTNTGGTATLGAVLGDAANTAITARIAALNNITVANILAGVVEGTLTVKEALRLITSASAGTLSGGGTNTLIFKDTTGTKSRITATVDANMNRTTIVTDLT